MRSEKGAPMKGLTCAFHGERTNPGMNETRRRSEAGAVGANDMEGVRTT